MAHLLQIDFDGTLIEGDSIVGLLTQFAGPAWRRHFEGAVESLLRDPEDPQLVSSLRLGASLVRASIDDCLAFFREKFAARPGLADLVDFAEGRGIECHVVSYGFDFCIEDHLDRAGVAGRVATHSGRSRATGNGIDLTYTGPNGEEVAGGFKALWTRYFKHLGHSVVYLGDGRSDLTAALRADIVFARDELWEAIPQRSQGNVRPFEDLHDVVGGLCEILAR